MSCLYMEYRSTLLDESFLFDGCESLTFFISYHSLNSCGRCQLSTEWSTFCYRCCSDLELMSFLSTRNREPFTESTPLMGTHALSVSLLQIFHSSHVSSPQGFEHSVKPQHPTVSAAHFPAFPPTDNPLKPCTSQRLPKAMDQPQH
jgi:hypothetical protein